MAVVLVLLLALAAGSVEAGPKGDPGRGRELYMEKCVLCHGGKGEGWDWSKKVAKPPIPVPDLAQVVPGLSDEYLFDVVKGGGEAVGKTRFMPAFDFQLSDQEVWDLIAYMRSLAKKAQ